VSFLELVKRLKVLLTRDERMGIQFVPPLVGDLDSFVLFGLVCSRIALVVGMLHKQGHILRLLCVEDVPEVVSVWYSALGKGIGKVATD
jgi:hypothetical protein